jgi:hypothetical protein
MECPEQGGIPQYVGDVERAGGLLSHGDETNRAVQIVGQRLFDQDVVSGGEGGGDRFGVGAVGSSDDARFRQPAACLELGKRVEAAINGQGVGIAEQPAADGIWFHHGDDPSPVGMVEQPTPVDVVPPLARPHHDYPNRRRASR